MENVGGLTQWQGSGINGGCRGPRLFWGATVEVSPDCDVCFELIFTMYPATFDYAVPETVEGAIDLLSRFGGGAKLLSGGQSLVPLMKLRLVQPTHVIDIGRLPGLANVLEDESVGAVQIGGLATHEQVGRSVIVREKLGLMAEAAGVIGDAQVRGWGTIGGALAEADPAGDWGPVMQALESSVECTGPTGTRVVDAASFFCDAYTTALAEDELITAVRVPVPPLGSTGTYLKMERRAGDFAVASVAVQLDLHGDNCCRKAGVALGAVGLTPIKVLAAEEVLAGQEVTPDVLDVAARHVIEAADPLADVRGSSDYKRAVCGALFRKAVDITLKRYSGQTVRGGHVR